MGDAIPRWASERAIALSDDVGVPCWHSVHDAFARYIASKEEAPVDPLLIEARKIVKAGLSERSHAKCNCRKEIDAGEWDNGGKVKAALAGIKRGFQLAKVST